jgi:hypothetical protein
MGADRPQNRDPPLQIRLLLRKAIGVPPSHVFNLFAEKILALWLT